MIKTREITPCKWVHPDEDAVRPDRMGKRTVMSGLMMSTGETT
jgi:hypothetical protein